MKFVHKVGHKKKVFLQTSLLPYVRQMSMVFLTVFIYIYCAGPVA